MNQISIGFTEPQLAWLRKQSKETGLSIGELLRRIVDQDRQKEICGDPATRRGRWNQRRGLTFNQAE